MPERRGDPRLRLVLCYHAISPDWPAALSARPEEFESQLSHLVRRGWRGVTFRELVTSDSPDRLVAVTFDDAYESVATRARPLLDAVGFPASVYAPTAHIGSGRPMMWPGIDRWMGTRWEPELVPMDWAGLRTLADHGWEVGSHTRTHPHLTTLGDTELDDELGRSRQECEEGLGLPCTTLAYPYGDVDDRVAAAAGRAGYSAACTLPSRLHDATPLQWPRVGVYNSDDLRRFAIKTSPLVNRVRSGSAWTLLESARRRLGGRR